MNLKSVFKILILFLAIAMSCLFLSSCSSTKKLKQKETYKNELKKESDSAGTSAVKVEEKKAEENKKTEVDECQSYEAEVADGKKVSVKEYDGSGNLKKETVFEGDGKVKASSGKKETVETKKVNQSKISDSKATSKVKKKEDEKAAGKKLDLNLEKKGYSFGDYIFWFILIIGIIILIYLNNRFKWIPIFNKENDNEKQ